MIDGEVENGCHRTNVRHFLPSSYSTVRPYASRLLKHYTGSKKKLGTGGLIYLQQLSNILLSLTISLLGIGLLIEVVMNCQSQVVL